MTFLGSKALVLFAMPSKYGAGELYGFDLSALPPERIRELSRAASKTMPCPFMPPLESGESRKCSKKGGACSLRLFTEQGDGKVACRDAPVVTCPTRFLENGVVFQWVGETLLGTGNPAIISELPFLMGDMSKMEPEDPDAVGKIDKVLVNEDGETLRWCALEMQAVYFSGKSMENDFKVMRDWTGPGIPFPEVQRRPDFRSSGPKRLMPQLQIKVPTISRWGKKMAVVIDKAFWSALGAMREVKDVSNCDIVWFVVSFRPSGSGRFMIQKDSTHFTTLSHAVEGLTGGTPMSLDRFEREIRARIARS